jgi:hypothetical protein
MSYLRKKWFFFNLIISLLAFVNYSTVFAFTEQGARNFFKIQPDHQVTFLPIKGYQQVLDYTCGPSAVMSLLHYYKKLSDEQMNATTEKKIADEMGSTELHGTNEKQIVNWLNRHGFRAESYHDGSIEKIRKYLTSGKPVLVDWIDWGGHWAATAGYSSPMAKHNDIEEDTIFFADSAANFDHITTKDGITWFNAKRFSLMWFNSNLTQNIYIIATPN